MLNSPQCLILEHQHIVPYGIYFIQLSYSIYIEHCYSIDDHVVAILLLYTVDNIFIQMSSLYGLSCNIITDHDLLIIYCNTAARGLTDIYIYIYIYIYMHDFRGPAASEGECGYISKTPSTSMLQHLCNTFNSCVYRCS